MLRLLPLIPLITAFSLSGAALAQESTSGDGADVSTEAEATEAPAEGDQSDLDMGKPVEEEEQYVKETYGDWQLRCYRTQAAEDPCQMFQLLREEAGNPIAEFSIFRLPGEAQAVAGATIIVPLGTLLTEELKIAVDGGKAKSYSYRFCSLVGCYAQIGLTDADIAAFKAGAAATLQIVPAQAPDQKVDIKVSLSGFTAAFDNTTVLEE